MTSTDTTSTTVTATPARSTAPWRDVLTITAVAYVAAVVACELVLLVGIAAEASFVLTVPGTPPHPVTSWDIVTTSTILPIGVLLAALLARWRRWFLRVGQVVGGALALLSVLGPLTGPTDSGTRLALSLMHVLVGAGAVIALEAIGRRR
ncbi:DUF6069 family protein [Pseudonocardia sp.]|uniref:DUF6069 family protein n=1 Tax=Pseudonocardia sp. TaxID=60912 RepID=UPI003D119A9E